MNSIIITLVIVETIQIIVLLATIVTDYENNSDEYRKDLRVIRSKKDFLIFFIPFFWVMPMLKSIIKYWNNLT
tara:strand:- start:668 stop:886 length:219 start_codon:yes stop_codon:yes gene_type:complete